MKLLIILFSLFLNPAEAKQSSIFDNSIEMANGEKLNLGKMKGKPVLFVNIATRCGYTGQLDDIEKLYQKYKAKGFHVVGIPSNDFGSQTPETGKDIVKFCKLKYGASFPITKRVSVKGDKNIHWPSILFQSLVEMKSVGTLRSSSLINQENLFNDFLLL